MSTLAPSPISPEALVEGLADRVLALRSPTVVVIDGAPATKPDELAAAVTEAVAVAGRRAVHIDTRTFWRDASIRLEYGREDIDSFLDWLDIAALRREVIEPLRTSRPVLPSLRDPETNRATRAQPVDLGDGVVLLSGAFLLRYDIDADLVVHLAASTPAIARRTSPDQAWTVAAFARYELESAPQLRSDVVVRCDDPRHPAVVGLR
jgi:hypothetical protein